MSEVVQARGLARGAGQVLARESFISPTVSSVTGTQPPASAATIWIAPYAVTIFTSATLLFVIQPTIAKQLLPWFGGAAAVWATCLVFFQCLLLLGYLYAHLSMRALSCKLQVLVHVLLLGTSVVAVFLPGPSHQHVAAVGSPVYECLKLLARSIGLPYFVLSSTTPLLQAWYARGAYTGLPYRLFALSNLGSLIALLAYPFVIERFLEIGWQLAIWRWIYVIFAVLCSLVAARALRHRSEVPSRSAGRHEDVNRDWRPNVTWVLLAACSSALLLGVTNDLCQNIAPIPLLWIIPLAIYLVSFAICFDHERLFKPAVYQVLIPIALIGLAWAEANTPSIDVRAAIPIYLSCLFIICMFCHGQLAMLKPHTRNLTSFYLCLSLGGALGGVFVGLLAPALFVDFFEVKIAIAACFVLGLRFLFGYRSKPFLLVCGVLAMVSLRVFGSLDGGSKTLRERNFYGILSIREYTDSFGNKVRTLVHGAVTHGGQLLSDDRRLEPTFYYGRASGVGIALQRSITHRVGIIGLGTGTVAAYGRPGDYYRFYELNPLVTQLAYSQFTFLRDSRARVDVTPGDGRLSLEHESSEHFDTLVLDAFSGDSIPVHLLTREAFECYFRHLNRDGIVAVHVSNQYLDLRPVVADIAARFGDQALFVPSAAEPKRGVAVADWILVTRDGSFLRHIANTRRGEFIRPTRDHLWTDQYSNIVSALR